MVLEHQLTLQVLSKQTCGLFVPSWYMVVSVLTWSHFTCCQLIWHFCNQVKIKKIDKVRFRVLRFMFNNFNSLCSMYSELRAMAERLLLHIDIVTEVFRLYSYCGVPAPGVGGGLCGAGLSVLSRGFSFDWLACARAAAAFFISGYTLSERRGLTFHAPWVCLLQEF